MRNHRNVAFVIHAGQLIRESKAKGKWFVRILDGGLSKNGRTWSSACLEATAPLLEGVAANCFELIGADGKVTFDHVTESAVGRSPLNTAGFYEGCYYDPKEDAVFGRLVLLEGNPLADKVQRHLESLEAAGRLDLIGLSIDAYGPVGPGPDHVIDHLDFVSSVDIVTHPAAGGQIGHRLAASHMKARRTRMKSKLLELLRSKQPRLVEGCTDSDSNTVVLKTATRRIIENDEFQSAQVLSLFQQDVAALMDSDPAALREQLKKTIAALDAIIGGDVDETAEDSAASEDPERVAASIDIDAKREAEEVMETIRKNGRIVESATKKLERRLGISLLKEACATAKLTPFVTQRLVESHKDGEIIKDEADAKRIAEAQMEYIDKVIGDANARIPGNHVRIVESADKQRLCLRAMLSPRFRYSESDDARKAREYLIDVGDSMHSWLQKFTGVDARLGIRGQSERRRLSEAVDQTSTSKVYEDALNLAILDEMGGIQDYQVWQKLVKRRSVKDFREYKSIKVGYYGELPVVAEGGPYTTLTTPGDSQEVIKVAKRGGLESITLEKLIDDDLGYWQALIQRIARASVETRHTVVMSLIRKASQPTLSDTHELTDTARVGDVNQVALALSKDEAGKDNFLSVVTTMMGLTGGSGKPKRARPKYIILPDALVPAWAFIRKEITGGLTGVEVREALGQLGGLLPDLVIDPDAADTNNWFALADPNQFPVIEFAELGGRSEPEMFLADDERFGSMFTNDKIDHKVRDIFGAAAVDYTGIVGSVNA